MKKTLIIATSLLIGYTGICCTTAVISGKYTKDGYPIIWKLRDTDNLKNKMMYFDDGKHYYIGLINSEDLTGDQVWGGANSTGFSIMNSASFNVNIGDTSSKKDVGYGFIRFQTAQEIFYQAESMGQLNYQTIIQDFSRCFKHAVLNKNFKEEYKNIPNGEHFINSDDLITRHGSSSALLIQGVKPEEPGDLATIWSIVGFPNTCIALPVWVRGGKNLPGLLVEDSSGNAPLNEIALKLKEQCYPIKRSSGSKYLQISELINSEGTGILQKIEIAEKTIFINTEAQLIKWKKSNSNEQEIVSYYNWLDDFVSKTYFNEFGIESTN